MKDEREFGGVIFRAYHNRWVSACGKVIQTARGGFRSKPRPEIGIYGGSQQHLDGYLRIKTRSGTKLVHRAVWIAWVGPIPDGLEINHKDGVKTNNALTNLEVGTHSENMLHAYATGLQVGMKGENHPSARLSVDQVIEIRNTHGFTLRQLGARYGVSYSLIHHIRSGRCWASVTQDVTQNNQLNFHFKNKANGKQK